MQRLSVINRRIIQNLGGLDLQRGFAASFTTSLSRRNATESLTKSPTAYEYFLGKFASTKLLDINPKGGTQKQYPRLRAQGFDYQKQAIEVGNAVWRRNVGTASEALGFKCPKTIFGFMQRGEEISGDGPCLGFRTNTVDPYQWISYTEIMKRVKNFGAGLMELGVKPDSGSDSFVGFFARTSPEWVIAEYGAYSQNLVVVPFYDSIGPDAAQSAINRLDVRLLICGDGSNLETMLAGQCGLKTVKTIIFIEAPSDEVRRKAEANGLRVLTFQNVEELGVKHAKPLNLPQPDDLALLMFTSGTTGVPKAAMLTHRAVTATVENIMIGLLPARVVSQSTAIAFLPLAHIMERLQEMCVYVQGARVGFNSNNTAHLIDDIQALRPDLLLLVPRVLNRVYAKMMEAVRDSKIKQAVLKTAIYFKNLEMKRGIYRNDSVWDRICLRKVQEILGGRIRICVTGSAPLDPNITTAMQAALGCYIYDGYGQTESAGIATCSVAGDAVAGHTGPPLGGSAAGDMEMKLIDVPELGYFVKDGKGEILIRGPQLMKGYYGMPEKTAEALDEDGFLRTGDVGQWINGGRLKIIDRKKNIFKLSHGEYVVPEKVESELSIHSPLISQIFVDGNSFQPFTVALIAPNYDLFPAMKDSNELAAVLLAELQTIGKARHLKSYEIPQKIYILPEPFTAENGFITPTQKVKREAVRTAFKKQLASMYNLD